MQNSYHIKTHVGVGYSVTVTTFQNFCCRSVSVGFRENFLNLDKSMKLPVFVITGCHKDVAVTKREILSASEHFKQPAPAPSVPEPRGGWRRG